MNSTVMCKLSIDHHVYDSIDCHERHVFKPFSNKNGGATTLVKQTLVLISETQTYRQLNHHVTVDRRTNLLFDHNSSPKPTSGELKISRELMKTLCQLSIDNMHIEYSDIFAKFVHISRSLSYTALYQLYSRAEIICSNGK